MKTYDDDGEDPTGYCNKQEIAVTRNDCLIEVAICKSTYYRGNQRGELKLKDIAEKIKNPRVFLLVLNMYSGTWVSTNFVF